MIKYLYACFVWYLSVVCILSLTTTPTRILTPLFVGCFQSYSSCDAFNQTLTLSECNSAAKLFTQASCWSGNCVQKKPCKTSQCLIPWGTCSGNNCNQCSATYNLVNYLSMTNDVCMQICIVKYGFTYAATTWGLYF